MRLGQPEKLSVFRNPILRAVGLLAALVPSAGAQICFQNQILNTMQGGIRAIDIAYMNGDTFPDIVTGRGTGFLTVWVNDGGAYPVFHPVNVSNQANAVQAVRVAFINDDTLPDILVASSTENTVAWYRNNGDLDDNGDLDFFTKIPISNQVLGARAVAAGDMNGDGHIDVVAASETDGTIVWFAGTGGFNPSFSEHPPVASGFAGAASVEIADIDGDGLPDVIATARLGFEVAWFRNNGGPSPSFTKQTISTNERRTETAVAVDMDNDGRLDVVAAARDDNRIRWYKNRPGPDETVLWDTFLVSDDIAFPVAVKALDLNGNGLIDVVAAGLTEDAVVWFQNNGGSPPTFTKREILGNFDGPIGLAVGDLTGNGAPDIASVAANANALAVHRQPRVLNQTSGLSYPLLSQALLAALDGDVLIAEPIHFDEVCGDLSLNFFGRAVEVRSTGPVVRTPRTATVLAGGSVLESAPGTPVEILGSLDVPQGAIATLIGDDVTLAGPLTVGLGGKLDAGPRARLAGVASLTERFVTDEANGVWSVRAGDVNGNGRIDLISADQLDNRVAWYENMGGLNPSFLRHPIDISVLNPRAVLPADVDGNGTTDILVASFNDNSISWFHNNGTNPPVFTQRPVTNQASGARSVAVGFLDDDNLLDVVSASENDDTIAWYQNLGGEQDYHFERKVITNSARGAASVIVADINGDGLPDIVSAARRGFEVAWYENNGDTPRTFTRRVISNQQSWVEFVVAADFNGDGAIDIAAASTVDNAVVWFLNNGGAVPTFTAIPVDQDIAQPVSLAAGDIDGDGDIDLAATGLVADQSYWYENDGESIPTFFRRAISENRDASRSIDIADLDGDGDLDLVAGSSRDDLIFWYQNGLNNEIVLDRTLSSITAPQGLQLVNKSVRIGLSTRIGSKTSVTIDRASRVSGLGALEAPLVLLGGELRPDRGKTISVLGSFVNSIPAQGQGRETGLLRIDLSTGSTATALSVSQTATLGGGLLVTAPAGFVPPTDVPLPLLLSASGGFDPLAPRFDVVYAPVLTVQGPDGPVQGTLVARYNDSGPQATVSMVPITLQELLFTTTTFSTEGTPNDAVIADVTGGLGGVPDGIPDLIIAVPSLETAPQGAIALLIGSESTDGLSFGSVILYTGPNVDAPIHVAAGNFDSAGAVEIAYANRGDATGAGSIHFLNANSSLPGVLFPSPLDSRAIGPGLQVTDLTVGDLIATPNDRDDLMFGVRGGGTSQVFVLTTFGSSFPWDTCVVDVDDIDSLVPFNRGAGRGLQNRLAATNPSNNTVRIFSIGPDGLDAATFVDIATGTRPRQVIAANLDGDAFTDIVILCEGNQTGVAGVVTLLRGTEEGFAGAVNLPLSLPDDPEPNPGSIVVCDVDDDGDLDLLVIATNPNEDRVVRELRNTSNDAGGEGLSFSVPADLRVQPVGLPIILLSADLDGDNAAADGLPDDFVVLVDPLAGTRGSGPTGNRISLSGFTAVCIADFNNSGTVDFFDLAAFLQSFNAQEPAADFAEPFGVWNFFDIATYLSFFNKGCP